ncbi:hypothetical protein, partial [uncultured Algoriphagus sp.]|uniref:hypothetical protein n=1 Tax=uncultured Algoriphagus sp. TaxID=417365 RepID=UPI0025942A22
MKNINLSFKSLKGIAKLFYFFAIVGFTSIEVFSQTTFNPVVFTPQTNSEAPDGVFRIRGDFSMLGNKNLTAVDPSDEDNGASTPMRYVDIDGVSSTVNSSSANLVFSTDGGLANPNCYEIVHAGLYWTGRTNTSTDNGNAATITVNGTTLTKNQVKLRFGNGAYQTVTAKNTSEILFPDNISNQLRGVFAGYADVTDFVKSNGSGTYTVADIFLRTAGVDNGGSTGLYGGWGMVVIYKNPTMSFRNISTFNGYSFVNAAATNASTGEFTVSGFEAIDQGPVNVKLGVMGGEGDKGISGDDLSIRNSANTGWVRLENGGPSNNGGNSLNNFFNSSIFTGGNTRVPNDNRNYGLDLHVFDLPNAGNVLIDNGDNQTRFRYRTDGDTYVIFNLTFAVDAYEPEIEAFHQVISINNSTPAGNIRPGEVADFSVELTNKSTTEGITDGKLEVQIPFGATVESTGFSFDNAITPSGNSAPSFDPNTGILTWEFGNLPLSSDVGLDLDDVLATLTYSLKATEDCLILFENSCTPDMNVDGVVTGTGAVSQSNLNRDFIIDREPAQDQCSSPTGLTGPIEISYNTDDFQCDIITDFEFCAPKDEVTLAEIEAIYDFPDGYTFYGGTDRTTAVQFDANTPFPGAGTYYAFPFGINVTNAANCYTEFTITVIEAPVAPTAEVTQPTCDVATGTITVTAPLGQGLTYSINGTDYQASTTFAGVNLGTYNVTVKSAAGCESLPAEVTVNPQPETPAAPVLTVPAPACDATSVTITFTAEAGVEYSLTNTFAELIVGGSFDAPVDSNGTVFARTEGTECVVSSPFTVAPAPASPDAPVLTVPAPACDATSVTITFTAEAGV